MAAIDSIDYMVSGWPLVERPALVRVHEQPPEYRSQIIAGYNALCGSIGHEVDLDPEEGGGTYEVDITGTNSLHWLEQGAEIKPDGLVIMSLVRLTRFVAPKVVLSTIRDAFPAPAVENSDSLLAFDLGVHLLKEATDWGGLPALLRLPNSAYAKYTGDPALLIAERLFGVASKEVPGQVVCLGSHEVNPALSAPPVGDSVFLRSLDIPPTYAVLPAGLRSGVAYNVPTDKKNVHHHEVYLDAAILRPSPANHK